jgi:glucan biosynthesis protein
MEITGNIKLITETETGTSKAGKEWAKRQIVVTTNETYPQDIAIDFMGDKITQINNFEVGNPVTVSINIRGNEYNGKYYNSINGWKIANTIGQVNNNDQQPAREKVEDLPF